LSIAGTLASTVGGGGGSFFKNGIMSTGIISLMRFDAG
jgi:hypothetical protein